MCAVHVILGVFDGVHQGHRALIRDAVQMVHPLQDEVVALTFHPHPKCVLSFLDAPPLIYSVEQRCLLLRQAGCDRVWVQRFTVNEAQWSPQEFLAYLEHLFPNLAAVSVGANFRFGHQGCGDVSILRAWCKGSPKRHLQVGALVVDEAKRISSTRIREALQCGQLADANRFLKLPYHLFGWVRSEGEVSDDGKFFLNGVPTRGGWFNETASMHAAKFYRAMGVCESASQSSMNHVFHKTRPVEAVLNAGVFRTEFCSWQPCLLKDGNYRCRLMNAESSQVCSVRVIEHRIWLKSPLQVVADTHVLLFEGL